MNDRIDTLKELRQASYLVVPQRWSDNMLIVFSDTPEGAIKAFASAGHTRPLSRRVAVIDLVKARECDAVSEHDFKVSSNVSVGLSRGDDWRARSATDDRHDDNASDEPTGPAREESE